MIEQILNRIFQIPNHLIEFVLLFELFSFMYFLIVLIKQKWIRLMGYSVTFIWIFLLTFKITHIKDCFAVSTPVDIKIINRTGLSQQVTLFQKLNDTQIGFYRTYWISKNGYLSIFLESEGPKYQTYYNSKISLFEFNRSEQLQELILTNENNRDFSKNDETLADRIKILGYYNSISKFLTLLNMLLVVLLIVRGILKKYSLQHKSRNI